MPDQNYTISVVIPLFNAENWIRETLESVCRQKLSPIEIVVVNDGSTDNSCSEIEIVAKKYPNLNIAVHTIENSGVSHARNVGIALCTGDLIALLDSDDIWLPQKLKLQYEYLISNQKCIAVLCDFYISKSISNSLLKDVRLISKNGVRDIGLNWLTLQGNGALISSTILFWRKKIIGNLGFSEDLNTTADLFFYLQLTQLGVVGHLTDPLVRYRQHESQMHLNSDLLKRDIPILLNALAQTTFKVDQQLVLGNMYVMSGILNLVRKNYRTGFTDIWWSLKINRTSVLIIPSTIIMKRIKSFVALKFEKWR